MVGHRLNDDSIGIIKKYLRSDLVSSLFLWVGVGHDFQRSNISDKPDVINMTVIKAVKTLSGIRPKIILPI